MKVVTVTERHTYEVDVDDMLIRLANFIRGDVHVQDFGRCVESEVVLVEIEDAGESGTEPCGKPASGGREAGEPFGSGDPTRERPGFDSQPGVSPLDTESLVAEMTAKLDKASASERPDGLQQLSEKSGRGQG